MLFQWMIPYLLLVLTKSSQLDAQLFSGEPLNATSTISEFGARSLLRRIVNKAEDCQTCTCGLSNKDRIVGGTDSDVNKYPWVAMLFSNGYFTCGSSLINNKYVLTAAHCVNPSQASQYEVRFLQNRFDTQDANAMTRRISQVIRHSNYNSKTLENDIALLKLTQPVQFNDKIRPVCLNTGANTYAGQNGIVIGWGALKENGKVSTQLQEVSVPILTNAKCRSFGLQVKASMMCAGEQKGGKDSCQGDSGGPLHVISGSKFTQAGIVSWGIGCAGPRRPGVYTRVTSYTTWIRRNTADACTC